MKYSMDGKIICADGLPAAFTTTEATGEVEAMLHRANAFDGLVADLARIASMSPGGPHISAKDGMGAALATIDRMRDIAKAALAQARGERETGS